MSCGIRKMAVWSAVLGGSLLAASCMTGKVGGEKGAAIPQWRGRTPNDPAGFRFVVMGDNTGGHITGEWASAVAQVNLLKPDFVICVGDLIEGYTTNPPALAGMWDEFDGFTAKLDAPFYFTPGNHDISNPFMRAEWERRYGVNGRTYYSFNYGNCHFVVLDTASLGYDKSLMTAELAWLAGDLKAASAADHVFVFYHIPQWMNAAVWPEFMKLFDPGKTTVFNGHWHSLSYGAPDGIPTYVIPSTGADMGPPDPDLGSLRALAHVSVNQGRPTVAILPMGSVLPGDYVIQSFADQFRKTISGAAPGPISGKGGDVSFVYANGLASALDVNIAWQASPWNVQPMSNQATVLPGEKVEMKFTVTAGENAASPPTYVVSCCTTNPAGRRVTATNGAPVAVYAELAIPALAAVSVDGNPQEWGHVPAVRISGPGSIYSGVDNWTGAPDLGVEWKVARDAAKLYVCVTVTDDQVANDALNAWDNDAVEFFWDARPVDRQDGKHGEGTGQVMLAFPRQGMNPVLEWGMGKRAAPTNMVVAMARQPGGYTCELSVPLAELGCRLPVVSRDRINLEVQVDDRDIVNGTPSLSHLSSGGRAFSYQTTRYFARGVFQ